MTGAAQDLAERVTRLETSVTSISDDVREIGGRLDGLGGKIDQVVSALTSTDGRAAERAQAVKSEIREEGERKAREKGELFTSGAILITIIVTIVGAFSLPYSQKLDSGAAAIAAATNAIADIRALDAQQTAEIARNRDGGEIGRERNRWQDEKLFDQAQRISRIEARAGER